MTTSDLMLDIARQAILNRAERDGYTPSEYDPAEDSEGYVISLLVALRHWTHTTNHDWYADLARAQELFEDDMREHEHEQSQLEKSAE